MSVKVAGRDVNYHRVEQMMLQANLGRRLRYLIKRMQLTRKGRREVTMLVTEDY